MLFLPNVRGFRTCKFKTVIVSMTAGEPLCDFSEVAKPAVIDDMTPRNAKTSKKATFRNFEIQESHSDYGRWERTCGPKCSKDDVMAM